MKSRDLIAAALGARDCAVGKKPKLNRQAYVRAYARQYEIEQRQTNRTLSEQF